MAMAAKRRLIDDLLREEGRRSSTATWGGGGGYDSPPSRLNAVWRRKVIHWFFTLIAALHDADPFRRASVYVTASLLDGYLTALPSERALRYGRDRRSYQLLATACLLIGARLARHESIEESRQLEAAGAQRDEGGALKRVKTHRKNLNEAAAGVSTARGGAAIPNAAGILHISGAPKSITERHVFSMAREVMGARSFPRSRVITALDFIRAFDAASNTPDTRVGQGVSLGPEELEVALRLADASLADAVFSSCRPSVVACAAITLTLARSSEADVNIASLRRRVHLSIFGDEDDPALVVAVRVAESNMLTAIRVGVSSSRNDSRQVAPIVHLIPLEDE